MGKIYSLLTRPIRTFNIENRAERIISREKPTPAPQYSSAQKQKEIVDKLNPEFMVTHYNKNPQLHHNLRNVFVQSKDPQANLKKEMVSFQPLPQDSSQTSLDDSRNTLISNGKCLLKDIVDFINMYQQDPIKYSIEEISQQYKLDKQIVENIIMNFRILYQVNNERLNSKKVEKE